MSERSVARPSHAIHARRPSCQEPIHGSTRAVERARGAVARPALEARRRVEDALDPDERVERRVAGVGRGGHPPVEVPAPRRRRREDALDPALAVAAVAHERARRAAVPGVAPERVVARRALEDVPSDPCFDRSAPRRARSASTGGRSASVGVTPGIRSSRMPAVTVGPGACATMIRTCSAETPFRPSAQPVPRRRGPRCDAAARSRPRSPSRAGRRRASGRRRARRAGAVKVTVEDVAIGRERAVGLPVRRRVAVERRERPVLGELRVAGRRRRGHALDAAAVDGDGLRVAALARTGRARRRRPTAARPPPAPGPRSAPAATARAPAGGWSR